MIIEMVHLVEKHWHTRGKIFKVDDRIGIPKEAYNDPHILRLIVLKYRPELVDGYVIYFGYDPYRQSVLIGYTHPSFEETKRGDMLPVEDLKRPNEVTLPHEIMRLHS